jgi:aldehyde dehydrogenase (NAD+)
LAKPIMSYEATVPRHRTFFKTGATRPLENRRRQLENLAAALSRSETRLLSALHDDLGKSPFQGYSSELGVVRMELEHALRNLSSWMARTRRATPWFVFPARAWVVPEPFGVTLILGPWNYPVQLLLTPLVSAIAAGNCVVLKPSEFAPRTAEAVTQLIQQTFPEHYVSVVNGGPDAAEALLRERFDKIFFTGSSRVGRLVMAAAAQHLTPVTLELGGKCPAIVCADAPLNLAARRLAWGKFLNAGQTCVAPDFVLVERAACRPFIQALKQALRAFYGEHPLHSHDYGRIVNRQHFERLRSYLGDGEVLFGGTFDEEELFIAPTILGEPRIDSPVMQEEIFGPILPVVTFDRLDDAVANLCEKPAPLALYLFTRNRQREARLLREIRSGGVCINDVVSHMAGAALPFGGLGESGMSAYHGRAGFEAFSHRRAVLRRGVWVDPPFRYPPQRTSMVGLKRAFRFLMKG